MSLVDLAEQLARAQARAFDAGPWLNSVAGVEQSYEVQSQFAQLARDDVRGWKVSALSPEQQRLYSASRPVAGALLAPYVHAAPASLSLKSFVTPLLECELSFLLGADLPARAGHYTRKEIEAAIEAAVSAMEIADCRWSPDAPDLLKLANSTGNGAFITGQPVKDWRALDLSNIAVTLSYNGSETEPGNIARILGNPLLAVIALANAQPLPAGGLKRGQIVTTGTCTNPIPPRAGRYAADFGALGTVQLDVTR